MLLNVEDVVQQINQLDPREILQAIGYEKSMPYISRNEIRDFCPIHGSDNQKSLAISKDGKFKCHSCNAEGGDMISLYMQAKKLDPHRDFLRAIEDLAHRFGIHLGKKNLKERTENPTLLQEKIKKSKKIAQDKWSKANEGTGPYFIKKKIEAPPGIRCGYDEQKNLSTIVPYRDTSNNLQSIQYISDHGKFFATNTTPIGAFFSLGSIAGSRFVYLCEGIATATSIWLSENKAITTLSCGSCWNLQHVVLSLKEKFPELEIIICLDSNIAAEKEGIKIFNLGLPNISFRKPKFENFLDDGGDKADFNDLHRLTNLREVATQLKEVYLPESIQKQCDSVLNIGLVREEALIKYYKNLPSGIDIGLRDGDNKIILPAGGYSVFSAPTKHGKTHALVNAAYIALQKDKDLQVVFITLEELAYPILLRFLNRHIELKLSERNISSLEHFYKNFGNEFESIKMCNREFKSSRESIAIFNKNRTHFENDFLKTGRLRILDLSSDEGRLSIVEHLCEKIKEIKRWLPNVKMIAIDYLQLLTIKRQGRLPRDEVLKEVCLKLKDLAAITGLTIVTAAQFNRQVQNEDDLHTASIGEGGSIERHASLVIGMWNRKFPQFNGGIKLDRAQKNEMLLNILVYRYGPSNRSFIAPYDGGIGKIDFCNTEPLEEPEKFKKEKSNSRWG